MSTGPCVQAPALLPLSKITPYRHCCLASLSRPKAPPMKETGSLAAEGHLAFLCWDCEENCRWCLCYWDLSPKLGGWPSQHHHCLPPQDKKDRLNNSNDDLIMIMTIYWTLTIAQYHIKCLKCIHFSSNIHTKLRATCNYSHCVDEDTKPVQDRTQAPLLRTQVQTHIVSWIAKALASVCCARDTPAQGKPLNRQRLCCEKQWDYLCHLVTSGDQHSPGP